MESRVLELKRLESLQKECEDQIEAIKDELKAEMSARGTEELHCGAFTAIWKTITSARFDSTAFKKAQPALYAAFTKQSSSRRFVIS